MILIIISITGVHLEEFENDIGLLRKCVNAVLSSWELNSTMVSDDYVHEMWVLEYSSLFIVFLNRLKFYFPPRYLFFDVIENFIHDLLWLILGFVLVQQRCIMLPLYKGESYLKKSLKLLLISIFQWTILVF